MRRAILRAAAAVLTSLAMLSCAQMEDMPVTPEPEAEEVENDGEIRTLHLGLMQTKTTTSYDSDEKAIKLQWNEGDKIVVVSSDGAYNYTLKKNESGVGLFEADDKGVVLNGNSVYIYHAGSDYYDGYITPESCQTGVQTQNGNGNMDHLNKTLLLMKGDATKVPTTVADLEGEMTTVNSVLNFNVNYPAGGLDEDEYPVAFVLVAESWSTHFVSNVKLTNTGIVKKTDDGNYCSIQLNLEGIKAGEWSEGNPLNLYLNVMMDDNELGSTDNWRFQIVTNKYRTLYQRSTIKNKPKEGYLYRDMKVSPATDPLSVSGDLKISATRVEYESAIVAKLYAKFEDGGLLQNGYNYINQLYTNIQIFNSSGECLGENYVESEDGDIGKGGIFTGEGCIYLSVTPGETYSYRPMMVVDGGVSYYGKLQTFTVPEITICTDQEIDMGSGIIWAGWNVGATKAEEIGGYYAWGETEEQKANDPSDATEVSKLYTKANYKFYTISGSACNINKYKTDGLVELEPEDDVAHVKWGGDWRMPTREDVQNLYNCTHGRRDYEYNGVKGLLVVGKGDYFDKNLFIPNGGLKAGPDGLQYEDYVMLWTSTLCTRNNSTNYAYYNYGAFVMQTKEPDTGSAWYIGNWWDSYIGAAREVGRNVRPVKSKTTAGE